MMVGLAEDDPTAEDCLLKGLYRKNERGYRLKHENFKELNDTYKTFISRN